MLKLAVRHTVKMKVRGKCAKHPRYNPHQGEGAIKGPCKECRALFEVVKAHEQLITAARRFEEVAAPYTVVSKRTVKPTDGEV
jgi:hypothetical protein